jgi:ankyrin repeat protein
LLSIDDEEMNRIDEELFEATCESNLPEVRRLVSVGADVNAKGDGNWTPLHEASLKGHLQVAIELIGHGADIEAKDIQGDTPLHFACYAGHLAVIIELIGSNDSDSATTSILGKRTSRGGANIEAKDIHGDTPLHYAALNGEVAVVKALLSGGANILAANNNGHFPIHKAVSAGKSAVSKYLLQRLYTTTRHLPLHELLEDLMWIGNRNSIVIDGPPLRFALVRNVLGVNDVVEIIEYLVGQDAALLSSLAKTVHCHST